jgi:myosin heavy subunit
MRLKTESLQPANPEILDGVDDLMQLSYLSEPSVLYNLQYRYSQDMIYVRIDVNFAFLWDSINGSLLIFIVL